MALFRILQRIPTAVWITSNADTSTLYGLLDNARKQATNQPVVITVVVYNLPGRDCAAGGSNNGPSDFERYKNEFIGPIFGQLKNFENVPNLRVSLILEPDALANLATNANQGRCREIAPTYKAGIAYAIQQLSMVRNAAIYLDAAWSGWLGYGDNRIKAANVFKEVVTLAGKGNLQNGLQMIRGFATNVANYDPFRNPNDKSLPAGLDAVDEQTYIRKFSENLQAAGLTGLKFIVDTSRNGRGSIRAWSSWCNVKNAGLGPRPTANTNDPLVDAFVWVKPPGESDGNSNFGNGYDPTCANADAFIPSPAAGEWNHGHLVAMVKNANPPLSQSAFQDETTVSESSDEKLVMNQ